MIYEAYVIDKYWPNFNFLLVIDQCPDIQGRFSAVLHEFNCYIIGAESLQTKYCEKCW